MKIAISTLFALSRINICFIAHQFYRLQDTLVDILVKVVDNALNAGKRMHKERYYAARIQQRRAVADFVSSVDCGVFNPLNAIESIAFDSEFSDAQKVKRIQGVLTDKSTQRKTANQQLTVFKTQTIRDVHEADYYQILTSQSRKLQNA